jgi:hypothetical protein
MNSPMIQWMRFFDVNGGPADRTLITLARSVFCGLPQSRIVEDANGLLRNCETRQTTAKVVRRLTQWEQPIKGRLLDKWGKEEIQGPSQVPAPASALDRLFTPTEPAADHPNFQQLQQLVDQLKTILDKQDWPSFKPKGSLQQVGELQLLRFLRETNKWGMAQEAWRARVFPVGELVAQGAGEKGLFWVVEVTDPMVLGWRAKRVGNKLWGFDMEAQSLMWRTCFSFEGWRVVPTAFLSPLHLYLTDSPLTGGNFQVAARSLGQPIPLLKWQARHGFGEISEGVMRRLHKELDLEELPDSPEGDVTRDRLAMGLMKSIIPDMSADEAFSALRQAHLKEHPEDKACFMVTETMVRDCVLATEHGKLTDVTHDT